MATQQFFRFVFVPLLAAGSVILAGHPSPATNVIATWDGAIGDWSDAAHWDSVLYPDNGNGGLTYDAVISGGNVTVDIPITIDGLDFSNGIITSEDDLDIATFDWSAGRIQGTGMIDVAGGTFSGGVKYLDQTMRLLGDVEWDSGTMSYSSNQGTLQVTAGNTFTASGTNNLTFSPILEIDAGGTFALTRTGTTTMSGPLNNEGQVDIAAGAVRLTVDTTAGGDYSIASPATLEVGSGTHVYTGDFSGDGLMRFTGGTTRFESPANYTVAHTEVAGGYVEFDTGATINLGVLPFTSGRIGGGDDLVVSSLDWSGGRFNGTGVVDVAGGTFSGGVKYLDQTMRLLGDVAWDSGTMSYYSNQGTLQVTAGTTFMASGTNNLTFSPILEIDAGGTFAVTRTATTSMSGPLNNEGQVDIAAGVLRLIVDTTAGGDYSIASPATLEVGSGTHVYTGDFSGDGLMRFTGGTTRFESPANYTVAHTEVAGGTVEFDTGATINLGVLPFTSGRIGGGDDLVISSLDWSAGRFQGTGVVDVADGTFGGSTKYLDQTMRLLGDVAWDSGTMSYYSNQGTLQVTAGTTFMASGTNNLTFSPILEIDAGGTFAVTRTATTSMSGPLNNEGQVDIAAGVLRLIVDTTAGGDYSIASPATLEVGSGTHVYTGDFSGDGLMRFTGGTTRFESPASYTVVHTDLAGGTVEFDTGATINLGVLPFTSGRIGGGDDLVISSLDWSAGRFQGTGVVDVADGTFGGSTKYLDQTMRLLGDVAWDSGTMSYYSNQGTLQVTAGTTFMASGTNNLTFSPILEIDAGGTFALTRTGTTTMSGPLNNEGQVDIAAGAVRLTVDTTAGGDYSIASPATLEVGSGTHVYTGDFSGDGLMRFTGGTTRFESPANYTVAHTEVAGGYVVFDTGATINLGVLPLPGGWIGGGDDLVISTLDWSGGRFNGTGVVDVAGGTFSGSTKYLDQTMRLGGDVAWDSGTMSYSSNQGTLQVTAGNTFTASGTNNLTFSPILEIDAGGTFAATRTGTTTMSGNLVNDGTVHLQESVLVLAGGGSGGGDFLIDPATTLRFQNNTFDFSGSLDVTNAATVELSNATVAADPIFVQPGGLIVGTGTLDSPTYISNEGEISGSFDESVGDFRR